MGITQSEDFTFKATIQDKWEENKKIYEGFIYLTDLLRENTKQEFLSICEWVWVNFSSI